MTKRDWSFLHREPTPPDPEEGIEETMTSEDLDEAYPLALGEAVEKFKGPYQKNQRWTILRYPDDSIKVIGLATSR